MNPKRKIFAGLSERNSLILLLLTLFAFFSVIAFLSDGCYGGADNYVHYRLSRYAFKYPKFLLDLWGKPLFTTLSSPFSQFGFIGIKIFNILTGLLTALFSYEIVKKLNYKNPLLIIPFLCFTPIYFIMLFTGLTEILFSFILILSVYLFLKNKFIAASIIVSLLPFARNEGFIMFPLFFIAFILVKKYKAIPFLASGFLFFSFIGSFYYHDFLWVINNNPYTGAKGIYGNGGLFDFVFANKEISGIPLSVMYLVGIVLLFCQLIFNWKSKVLTNNIEFILIFLPLMTYLSFHSILWWKGLGSSLGLVRVMAAVMPLGAILSLKGYNYVEKIFSFNKWIKAFFLIAILFIVIRTVFVIYQVPVRLDTPQQLVKETADWLRESTYYKNKIYYYDPFFPEMLDIDPYDESRIQELIPNREKPEEGIPIGGIVLWDAHFCPNEGALPLNALLENPHFKLVKLIKPKESFKVLGGYDYEIYIFQKI